MLSTWFYKKLNIVGQFPFVLASVIRNHDFLSKDVVVVVVVAIDEVIVVAVMINLLNVKYQ